MNNLKFKARVKFNGNIGSDKWIESSGARLTGDRVFLGGVQCQRHTLCLALGLKDAKGHDWYVNDKGCFKNGDTFIIKLEDWLQPYIEWVGEPICEDQGRDLYRIDKALIIGNVFDKGSY